MITLKWILKKLFEGMDWIHLADNMAKWREHLNTVINLRVPG
jgi:hypothetical protein